MRAILPDIFTWSWFSEPHGYDFNGYLVVHEEGNLCIDPVVPGDDLAERAERGAGEDARHEPVGEQPDGPRLAAQEDHERQQHHATGDQAGGHLVDRVREGEQLAHHRIPYR